MTFTITLEDDVYEKVIKLCEEAGETIQSLFEKFINKCIKDGRVPIELLDEEIKVPL